MELVTDKNGGQRARYPRMESRTPKSNPAPHWKAVEAHLKAEQPANQAGLKKARKMQRRLA